MKKFNVFYYGEDRSHCGSCWESSDEDIEIILAPISASDMELYFMDYLNSCLEGYSYKDFISYLKGQLCLHEEDDEKYIPYIAFEQSGNSWCPDFYSNIIEYEIDLSTNLKPEKVVGEEFFKSMQDRWEENKKKRLEREKEKKDKAEKAAAKRAKEKAKKNELALFQKLKKKYEGS